MRDAKRAIARQTVDAEFCGIVTGELVALVDDQPMVRLDGAAGAVAAASIVPAAEYFAPDGSLLVGCALMVALRGPAQAPVVMGVVRDALVRNVVHDRRQGKTVLVDGERIVFTGEREILLKCGDAEILLRSDGKVVVKGCDIVSRASGRNRIKGATVGIN